MCSNVPHETVRTEAVVTLIIAPLLILYEWLFGGAADRRKDS